MHSRKPQTSIPVSKQFLRLLRLYSKAVFNTFDKNLSPTVTLVRLRLDNNALKYEIQPEDSPFAQFILRYIKTQKRAISTALYNHKEAQLDTLKGQISVEITGAPAFGSHMFFMTDLVLVDKWYTLTLVSLDRETYNSYYRLSGKNDTAPHSLLDAVCSEFSSDINKFLHQFGREDYEKTLDFQSTIRNGSKKLLKILGYSGLWDTTYDKLNKISSLNYEGKAIRGRILFTRKNILNKEGGHPNLDILMTFAARTPLSNFRHVRKLLELSRGDICLISDSESIYGLGRKRGDYQLSREDLFEIEFTNYYTWVLLHNSQKLMRVSHEHISLPKAKIEYDQFFFKLKQIYPTLDHQKIRTLYLLVMEAIRYNTGTLIVFTPNAASEAKRLKNQCFQVEAIPMTKDVIRSVINIDGAILMDLEGICHGIGAILDGMASVRGDTARGARYNSAIRYVETVGKIDTYSDCVAVVISDDGFIDIITKYTI